MDLDKIKIPNGKVLVKMKREDYDEDVTLITPEKSGWGEVVSIGKPCYPLYSKWRMFLYHILGINPCILQENSLVLLPRMAGQQLIIDNEDYVVLYHNEINLVKN